RRLKANLPQSGSQRKRHEQAEKERKTGRPEQQELPENRLVIEGRNDHSDQREAESQRRQITDEHLGIRRRGSYRSSQSSPERQPNRSRHDSGQPIESEAVCRGKGVDMMRHPQARV